MAPPSERRRAAIALAVVILVFVVILAALALGQPVVAAVGSAVLVLAWFLARAAARR